jgi:hypothetical protein
LGSNIELAIYLCSEFENLGIELSGDFIGLSQKHRTIGRRPKDQTHDRYADT